jgi:type I restriction enzyme S subunit
MRAYEMRDIADETLADVNDSLHAMLGVSPFREDDVEYLGSAGQPKAFSVSFGEIGDRLDAAHHVPVVRSVVHKLKTGHYPLVTLDSVADKVYVAPRFARIYVRREYGFPLLQGSHITLFRPYGLKYISSSMTKGLERWIIEQGWVLVTCSGTIGRVAPVSASQNGWAASQHILRIMPSKRIHAGFLSAFLATPYGQHQLKAKIYGGVVDELTAEDTALILVPDVPMKIQRPLGQRVLQAYEMRDQAAALEAEAIKKTEMAIRAAAISVN